MAGKIKNTQALELQIKFLELKAKALEDKLDENLDYLQENYSSMIMGSIFNKEGIKNSVMGSVAGFFLGNEKLQEAVSGIMGTLAEKASSGLEKLSERFSKKTEE